MCAGKGLEGRKYDAVESSGGVLYVREGGRKFAYRSTRMRAGLRARVSDHVENLSVYRLATTRCTRVFRIKNHSSGPVRKSILQLRANVKRMEGREIDEIKKYLLYKK